MLGATPVSDGQGRAAGWPRLPSSFITGTAVLIVLAVLAGWFGRSATTPPPVAPPPPARAVALGPLDVSVPGTWAVARGPVAGLPDLGRDAKAFAPVPGLSGRAVLSVAPFDDATLVPRALRPLVGDARPAKAALAGMPAWTYRAEGLASGRVAQVTVAPTTAGSVTAVCIASADAWSAAADCAEGFTAGDLRGASPLVPSPTLAFRRRLVPVLDHLGDRRAALRGRLRAATTRRGQARFAARLARAHARAAAVLAPLAPATGAPQKVLRELGGSTRAYRRLSAAAATGRRAGYRRARAAIRAHDAALARSLAAVR